MRLNLGCGRAQFPTTKDNLFTKHQLYVIEGCVPNAFEDAGWVNVDSAPIEGVDEVVDLFTYPWRWADNSVDEIFCSHIIEHIPHHANLAGLVSETLARAAKLDGWYAFFYEAWRVLKPGATIHIIAPYGLSTGAFTDPSHTRYLTFGAFGYFFANPNAPFDYQIPAAFQQDQNGIVAYTAYGQQIVAEQGADAALRTMDAIAEFYIGLQAVK